MLRGTTGYLHPVLGSFSLQSNPNILIKVETNKTGEKTKIIAANKNPFTTIPVYFFIRAQLSFATTSILTFLRSLAHVDWRHLIIPHSAIGALLLLPS
jgi:hypothetical protein